MNEQEKVTAVSNGSDVRGSEISNTASETDTQAAESELRLESEAFTVEAVSSEMTVTEVSEKTVIDENIISSIVEQAMIESMGETETQAVTAAFSVTETAQAVTDVPVEQVYETVSETVTEAAEISKLPETSYVTESVMEMPGQSVPEGTTSPLTNALLPAMAVGFTAAAAIIAKKSGRAKGYNGDEDMNARDRDNIRLAAGKPKKSKKKKRKFPK